MRSFVAALVGLLAVLPLGAQDEKDKDKARKQDVVTDQARIEQELQNLEKKMSELIEILRKKDQEHYAKKLEDGLKKLRSDRVLVNIRAVLEHLTGSRPEKAMEAGEDVSRALEGLLALLEDRTDPEEIKKQIADLQTALQKLSEIQKQEEKLKKDTEDLNKDRGEDLEQVQKDLGELIELQKRLQEDTDSGKPAELTQKLADAIKEIEKLQKEQKDAEKAFEQAKSKELRDVGELAKKLDELIQRQEKAAKQREANESRLQALDKALGELEKTIQDQKKASEQRRRPPRRRRRPTRRPSRRRRRT